MITYPRGLEISLVFANYERKGGTILDVKIDFTKNIFPVIEGYVLSKS